LVGQGVVVRALLDDGDRGIGSGRKEGLEKADATVASAQDDDIESLILIAPPEAGGIHHTVLPVVRH